MHEGLSQSSRETLANKIQCMNNATHVGRKCHISNANHYALSLLTIFKQLTEK